MYTYRVSCVFVFETRLALIALDTEIQYYQVLELEVGVVFHCSHSKGVVTARRLAIFTKGARGAWYGQLTPHPWGWRLSSSYLRYARTLHSASPPRTCSTTITAFQHWRTLIFRRRQDGEYLQQGLSCEHVGALGERRGVKTSVQQRSVGTAVHCVSCRYHIHIPGIRTRYIIRPGFNADEQAPFDQISKWFEHEHDIVYTGYQVLYSVRQSACKVQSSRSSRMAATHGSSSACRHVHMFACSHVYGFTKNSLLATFVLSLLNTSCDDFRILCQDKARCCCCSFLYASPLSPSLRTIPNKAVSSDSGQHVSVVSNVALLLYTDVFCQNVLGWNEASSRCW